MAPEPFDPGATARAFLAAYAAKDLERIAALLAPAVSLRDWNQQLNGRDAFQAETQKNFDAAQTLAIEVLHRHATACSVTSELRIVVDGQIALRVADVFDFDPQGRICAVRAYKG